ncbi:hypothetical protein SAMN02745221_01719 [Thermosyntropha lipolytica DSM 11003]|uniref:Uncharacterized protein n=1 Tax=Thermosyntropha lipolytica DSM 11003 TaxID=1123382 RepID=A0A1M5QCP6_9FIRM|nr:hypothetical protein [Thermosyntropha lipolytica]SHH11626.1 hypothetical protein SAMN02745221_01719 [Thermosyntropha lipolytica DSM 11003]
MKKRWIKSRLLEDYQMLTRYAEGKKIKKILDLTETSITLLMEDNTIIQFLWLEDEIIFDIKPPSI